MPNLSLRRDLEPNKYGILNADEAHNGELQKE